MREGGQRCRAGRGGPAGDVIFFVCLFFEQQLPKRSLSLSQPPLWKRTPPTTATLSPHSDDADLVGHVQGVVVGRQADVRLLGAVRADERVDARGGRVVQGGDRLLDGPLGGADVDQEDERVVLLDLVVGGEKGEEGKRRGSECAEKGARVSFFFSLSPTRLSAHARGSSSLPSFLSVLTFFMADSVVRGYLMTSNASSLGRPGALGSGGKGKRGGGVSGGGEVEGERSRGPRRSERAAGGGAGGPPPARTTRPSTLPPTAPQTLSPRRPAPLAPPPPVHYPPHPHLCRGNLGVRASCSVRGRWKTTDVRTRRFLVCVFFFTVLAALAALALTSSGRGGVGGEERREGEVRRGRGRECGGRWAP